MGATIPKADMDVRVGGRRHIAMEIETPSGPMQMYFVGEYREVEPKTRLVYTEAIADEHGGTPAVVGDHAATEVRVDFEDLGSRTWMVLVHAGIPQDSPGAAVEMALNKLAAQVAVANQR